MSNHSLEPGAVSGWLRRFIGFLSRRALPIAIGALVLFVLALLAAARLQLRSDFTELLPQDDPELKQLRDLGDRIGASSNLIVAVQGPDPGANERFAEALVGNLQRLIGTDLRAIDYRADAGKAFFEHNKALYADQRDLRRADDDLKKLLASKKNPAFIPFADEDLGEEVDDPSKDLTKLKEGLEQRRKSGRFPNGYYESQDRKLLAIVTWTNSSGTGDRSGFAIRDDVLRVIDETRPSSFGDVRADVTGDVASAIAEHDALKSDIEAVSIVCTILVIAVIVLYYGSVFSLLQIFFPTLLGVGLAFAFAEWTIGYLNTNTAFLGSIILGNGINFGIIFLARYREERARDSGVSTEDALAIAVARTARPTLAAALCAGIAYASLALTRFRGFRQFGEIGGVGMVLCWLATYTYGPALICFLERTFPRRRRPRATLPVAALTGASAWLLARRRPLIAAVLVVSGVALVAVAPLARNPFEYDFSKLRNQHSRRSGAGDLYVRVGAIFPQDLAPVGIALMPSASDAAAYRTALLTKDCADGLTRAGDAHASSPAALAAECARRVAAGEPTGGLLMKVATADDALPKDQDEKLAVLADIRRRLADPSFDLLSADERQQVDTWMPPADLRPLTYADLPEPVIRRFREVDGTVGRVAMIYPVRVWPNWDGHALIRLSDVIKGVRLPNGKVVDAAGHSSLFAAMLRSIARDGPIATEAAFFGVVLMVILLFRRLRSVAFVLLSLGAGVLWMGGAGSLLGLRLNFLNFVVLPVTLGIGVDYAVNVFARLENEPLANHARALAETGSAVALCSSTTIIGYSSLLIASNGALRSFGKLAVLGEVGCLLAALLLVPAVTHVRALHRRLTPSTTPTNPPDTSADA
jgi:predicted RND superfamily exporter protein